MEKRNELKEFISQNWFDLNLNAELNDILEYVDKKRPIFFDDDKRLLSSDEIINYKKDLQISLDIIPLVDLQDNNFLVFDISAQKFKLCDISEEEMYKEIPSIKNYIELIKLGEFKYLYNKYINERNMENESILLKTILFDSLFWVCYKESEEEGQIYRFIRDENEKLVLQIYSNFNEIEQEAKVKYWKGYTKFEGILQIVNENLVDEILINPMTDNFRISSMQLMDLNRQKIYNETAEPIILHEDKDLLKPAYKIEELQSTNNRINELYSIYLQDETDENMSNLYSELINNATFFTPVSPEESTSYDENGHPLISKRGVLQSILEKGDRIYCLYLSTKNILEDTFEYKKIEKENLYYSIFSFDDYITLIDSFNGTIKQLYIFGDKFFSLSIDILNDLKAQKDRYARMEGAIVIESQMAKTEEDNALNIEKLKKYFHSIESIKKSSALLETYLLKNKAMYKVYKIVVETNKELDKKELEEKIRKILRNRCFKLSLILNKEEDKTTKEEVKQHVRLKKVHSEIAMSTLPKYFYHFA